MSRLLSDLDPRIRPMVDTFLDAIAAAGLDVIITSTRRTFAEQDALFAQGRTTPGPIVTQARAGESPHCFGLALDLVPVVNGKVDWHGSDSVWETLGEMGEQAGLEWGGSWPKFQDISHFQHREWRLIAQQIDT